MTTKAFNWGTLNARQRMRKNGSEPAEPEGVHLKPNHAAEAERAARLRHYLETSPRGERDVSSQLDAMEKARGTWLREVLNACGE